MLRLARAGTHLSPPRGKPCRGHGRYVTASASALGGASKPEGAHRGVRHLEGPLKLRLDRQQPVEIIRVAVAAAEFPHRVHAAHHAPGDFRRIVDDDGEALERLRPERAGDEAADLLEVRRCIARPGEYDGERLVAIGRIEQYPS